MSNKKAPEPHERLRAIMKERGVSVAQLSRIVEADMRTRGVEVNAATARVGLFAILSGTRAATSVYWSRACRGLGISLSDLSSSDRWIAAQVGSSD